MIIEKIQHYLFLCFVIVLIFVQSFIFVMTRAESYSDLQVNFLIPVSTFVYKGEEIIFEAKALNEIFVIC